MGLLGLQRVQPGVPWPVAILELDVCQPRQDLLGLVQVVAVPAGVQLTSFVPQRLGGAGLAE